MHANSEAIAHLVDQVAALDDAPDRHRFEWFYADLARLVADTVDDALADDLHDVRAAKVEDAYNDGHDAGYARGLEDGHRERLAAASANGHRTGFGASNHRAALRAATAAAFRRDGHVRGVAHHRSRGGEHGSGGTH